MNMMKPAFHNVFLVLVFGFPGFLGAGEAKEIGYVVIFVSEPSDGRWNIACLPMQHEVEEAPPLSVGYCSNMALIWGSMFPEVPLVVSPELIGRPIDAIEFPNLGSVNDPIQLFEEFIGLCGCRSLHLAPLLSLTPASGIDTYENVFSSGHMPAMLLTASASIEKGDWRIFTKAADNAYRESLGPAGDLEPLEIASDDDAERFWLSYFPEQLSGFYSKVTICRYNPVEGFVIYRVESRHGPGGMAGHLLNVFTRPVLNEDANIEVIEVQPIKRDSP